MDAFLLRGPISKTLNSFHYLLLFFPRTFKQYSITCVGHRKWRKHQ